MRVKVVIEVSKGYGNEVAFESRELDVVNLNEAMNTVEWLAELVARSVKNRVRARRAVEEYKPIADEEDEEIDWDSVAAAVRQAGTEEQAAKDEAAFKFYEDPVNLEPADGEPVRYREGGEAPDE